MIFLVHHGDAVSPEIDPQRPLSERGRADVERLASDAAARRVKPDAIWHSGKLRARQTAEAFWRACNPLAGFSAVRGLQPDDSPEWVADQVRGETRHVMLVGHLPNLRLVLALLIEGRADAVIEFPPHGLVAIEETEGGWVRRWQLG